MKERIYLNNLYDIYGELLDSKKKEYFEMYYFDNLSLQEISDNLGVSRNAIFKQIKNAEAKLLFYEEKLELFKKKEVLNEVIENTSESIKEKLESISW
ncbi:MAG: sigma factor-like helix-turn-helix DNA-binding protein [bacterium]|nr:sigma factor-like helix-turn-helix DNA-binding protein [bacterium]